MSEITALKAVAEATFMRPRSSVMTKESARDQIGSLALSSISKLVSNVYHRRSGRGVLAFLRYEEPGSPSSRANAHVTLDAAAVTATTADTSNIKSRDARPVVKAVELGSACWKIWMKGNPVGEVKAACTSPMQNSIINIIPMPRRPLIHILSIKLFGTSTSGFSTSSHMWIAPSAPV
jgi:hypothetical protein